MCKCGRVWQADGVASYSTFVTAVRLLPKLGPGHYLTQLLSPISNAAKWLHTDGGCDCQKYSAEMDRNGVEWCEANIETIVGWLREGAAAHSLPFSAIVARWFIHRAIHHAKNSL